MSTHQEFLTKLADAIVATEGLLCKFGSDADHVAVMAAVTDLPLGSMLDTPSAAEQPVAVQLLSASRETADLVAGEAIAAGVFVYAGADGKVTTLPSGAGTYYRVGRALTAATADGDRIEVETCMPVAEVVSG